MFVVGWGANMFAPLLGEYRTALTSVDVTGLFGAYVLGLMPALLIAAPLSNRWGRRAVLRPVLVLSAIGSLVLLFAGDSFFGLLAGRILVGIAAGGAFTPGTTWVKELSDRAGASAAGARRAAVALTGGFATGPLLTGLLAQWAPLPEVIPYLIQIALVVVVFVFIRRAPETVEVAGMPDAPAGASGSAVPSNRLGALLRSRVFLAAILPTAPWVFGAATASLAALPSHVDVGPFGELVSGLVAAVTLGTGILVQPWAGRLALRSRRAGFQWGLAALVAGMLLGALTAATHSVLAFAPAAVLLGAAYGLLIVSGLRTIDELASAHELAALTGVFYCVTYVGFAFPLLDSVFDPVISAPGVFLIAAALGAAAFLGVASAWKPGAARRG